MTSSSFLTPVADPNAAVAVRTDRHTSPVETAFLRRAYGGDLAHVVERVLPYARGPECLPAAVAELIAASHAKKDGSYQALLSHPAGGATYAVIGDGLIGLKTAASDADAARAISEGLAEQLSGELDDDGLTPVSVWVMEVHPREFRRRIQVPTWQEIAGNYSPGARAEMEALMRVQQTPAARLILAHGQPGSGKTFAVRALIKAWAGWCETAIITDPEALFSDAPSYLLDVATKPSTTSADGKALARLIIIEDAGDLVGVEQSRGGGIGRVLNLTDGLLGQGLPVMVLITTNEPLAVLNPAVTRPGRCLAEVSFDLLNPDEANAWLRAHGSEASVRTPTALAELYALANGENLPAARRQAVGFAPAGD